MLKMIAIGSVLLLATAAPLRAQPAAAPAHSATAAHARSVQARPGASSDLAADQFASESAAKAHCPGDTVVWANLGGSKAYHLSGNKYFGKTKHGAFMCQKEADQSGFHPAGRRAHAAPAKTTKTAR